MLAGMGVVQYRYSDHTHGDNHILLSSYPTQNLLKIVTMIATIRLKNKKQKIRTPHKKKVLQKSCSWKTINKLACIKIQWLINTNITFILWCVRLLNEKKKRKINCCVTFYIKRLRLRMDYIIRIKWIQQMKTFDNKCSWLNNCLTHATAEILCIHISKLQHINSLSSWRWVISNR